MLNLHMPNIVIRIEISNINLCKFEEQDVHMQPGMATQIELLKLTGNSSAFCIKLDIFACVVATSKLKPIQLQFSCSDLHRKRAPDSMFNITSLFLHEPAGIYFGPDKK